MSTYSKLEQTPFAKAVLRRSSAALVQNTVHWFSLKVCAHPEDAEDTMQDVLVKLKPYLREFDNPQALSGWLYEVARNGCLMNRRGDRKSCTKDGSLNELLQCLRVPGPHPKQRPQIPGPIIRDGASPAADSRKAP